MGILYVNKFRIKKYLTFLFLIILIVGHNSCKKDELNDGLTIEQKIENAKKWYEQEVAQSKGYLKSDAGDSVKLIQELLWDKVETTILTDQSLVITVPIKSNLIKLGIGLNNQNLVINYKDDLIQSKIVNVFFNNKTDTTRLSPVKLYEIAFLGSIVNKEAKYHNQIVNKNIDSDLILNTSVKSTIGAKKIANSPNNNAKMESVQCSDWYLITNYYDGYGGIIGQSEQYLGRTCNNGVGLDQDQPAPGEWGGTPGYEESQRDVVLDTSITNNPKLNCLLKKMLGLNSTAGNAQMLNLLTAFVGKGFNVTFKIGTTVDPNSKGETGPDPNNLTKYNIVLNRNKINTESQMSWVKTLLHEAFHANLMQKAYEMFGDYTVGLWPIGPKDMTLEQLMDKIENVTQSNPTLAQQHHEFMAMNIGFIKDGLKNFSAANNTNHTNFNEDRFEALAYQGLELTSYYINKVCKDVNGNIIMVNYSGGNYTLAQVHNNKAGDLMTNSTIPCN